MQTWWGWERFSHRRSLYHLDHIANKPPIDLSSELEKSQRSNFYPRQNNTITFGTVGRQRTCVLKFNMGTKLKDNNDFMVDVDEEHIIKPKARKTRID